MTNNPHNLPNGTLDKKSKINTVTLHTVYQGSMLGVEQKGRKEDLGWLR